MPWTHDHGITVIPGPLVSEVILSPREIDFTGIDRPDVVVALAAEGVARRQAVFGQLDSSDGLSKRPIWRSPQPLLFAVRRLTRLVQYVSEYPGQTAVAAAVAVGPKFL